MKRTSISGLLLCLILMSTMITGAKADTFHVKKVQGKLVKMLIGNDSCVIEMETTDGSAINLRQVSNLDGWTMEQQKEYRRLIKDLPGKSWPTLTDLHSKAAAWYIDEGKTKILIKYKIISYPQELWITIISSQKDSSQAHSAKHKAYLQGFIPDVIFSSDYARLRPGYYIVIVGAFEKKPLALRSLQTAKGKGWKDAYIKRIR